MLAAVARGVGNVVRNSARSILTLRQGISPLRQKKVMGIAVLQSQDLIGMIIVVEGIIVIVRGGGNVLYRRYLAVRNILLKVNSNNDFSIKEFRND